MKRRIRFITLCCSLFVTNIVHGEELFKPTDNLYMGVGLGFLSGVNGQPASISNVAVAWDMNVGYWFGQAKYTGLRVGYSGDCLQSFNYEGHKVYGWNTIYADAMLNLSTLMYKTPTTKKDPRWYCSPFVSLEALVPMGQNHYHSAFGLGVGIANEIYVHKNVSVTLDWRNTIAFVDGAKWLPELTAGLRFHFTGKSRHQGAEKSELCDTIIVNDCGWQDEIIVSLRQDTAQLHQYISQIESDTTIYHLEKRIIIDNLIMNCDDPYYYAYVNRTIAAYQQLNDNDPDKKKYLPKYKQLLSYYDYTLKLYNILDGRDRQLHSSTYNKEIWKSAFYRDINRELPNDKIEYIPYLTRTIKQIKIEMEKERPNFSAILAELKDALESNPNYHQ